MADRLRALEARGATWAAYTEALFAALVLHWAEVVAALGGAVTD